MSKWEQTDITSRNQNFSSLILLANPPFIQSVSKYFSVHTMNVKPFSKSPKKSPKKHRISNIKPIGTIKMSTKSSQRKAPN